MGDQFRFVYTWGRWKQAEVQALPRHYIQALEGKAKSLLTVGGSSSNRLSMLQQRQPASSSNSSSPSGSSRSDSKGSSVRKTQKSEEKIQSETISKLNMGHF